MYVDTYWRQQGGDQVAASARPDICEFRVMVGRDNAFTVSLQRNIAYIRAFAESLAEATAKLNAIADQLEADAEAEKGATT